MTEYITNNHTPNEDGTTVGLPGNTGYLYNWQRILAAGGTSEFSEIRMRGPIYDKNGVELLAGGGGGVLNNYTAVVDPTANDDSTLGYQVGSVWLNTVTGIFFRARITTPAAAVWVYDTSSRSTNGNLVLDGGILGGLSQNVVMITPNASGFVNGVSAIAIGDQAVAVDNGAIGIGFTAGSGAADAVAIGSGANAGGINAVGIGHNAFALQLNSVAIGFDSRCAGADCVSIGAGAKSGLLGTANSTAIGYTAECDASNTVAIGDGTACQSTGAIALGHQSRVNGVGATSSICIGDGCQVNNVPDTIVIGQNATCTGTDSVVVGHDTSSNGNFSVVVGDGATVAQNGGVAIGSGATVAAGPAPLMAIAFGGANPVTTTAQFARLPVRVAGVDRNILMRDTDLGLDDLTDVAITAPIQGQNLTYNGANWVNTDIPYSPTLMPSQATAVVNAGANAFYNNIYTFQLPWDAYYRYARIWVGTNAVSTSSVRVTIYDGAANAGGTRKCYSDTVTPAINYFGFVVLDLSFVVDSNLIFTKNTSYSIMISANNPGGTNLFLASYTAITNNGTYGTNATTNYITVLPLANCPVQANSGVRIGFVLSNIP